MVDDSVKYRYQTVKVIRGREAKKIAEMERQGWEVDQQTTGRLRSEVTFRRVVPPTRFKPWMGVAALFGVGIVLLGGVAIAEAVGGGSDSKRATEPPAAAVTKSAEPSEAATAEPLPTSAAPSETPSETASETPSETSSATPTEPLPSTPSQPPTTAAPPADEILTVKNNPDLKRLLAKGESAAVCKNFAAAYSARTIEFDGSVSVAGGGTYLVYAGDDSDTDFVPGPAFQFRTLTVDGRRPAPGDNLHFTAKVGTYNDTQELFALIQVATTPR